MKIGFLTARCDLCHSIERMPIYKESCISVECPNCAYNTSIGFYIEHSEEPMILESLPDLKH